MPDLLSEPLNSGVLQSSFQRLYKPIVNRQSEVNAFWVENEGDIATSVEIRFLFNGQERRWITLPLDPGDKAELIDGAPVGVMDSDEIQGRSDANNQVIFNIFGKTKLK